MSLSPELCLRSVLDTLQNRITPELTDSYSGEVARLTGLVLTIVTNGIDDAAAIRIAENEAMRQLFRDAAGTVGQADLAAKLLEAASATGAGFKLSQLDQDNAQLRAVLVELHTAVEETLSETTRNMGGRIWRMLKQFEAARAPRR
jgi:hypothetical protein